MKLEKDKSGNIILKPVTGWQTHELMGSAGLLVMQFVENPDQMRTDERKQIQFVLTPPQCLELAGVLKRTGEKLMEVPPNQTPS